MKKRELLQAIIANCTAFALLVTMLTGCIQNGNDPTVTDPTNSSSPSQSAPTQSKPTDPTKTDPTQTNPTQTNPTDPDPTDPDPTDPDPTDPDPTDPDPTDPDPTDPDPTDPDPTDPDPTDPDPTDPTIPIDGPLYTREELEKLSTESHGFGPGRTSGGARPKYPQQDQAKYGQYGADFIAPDDGNVYLTFDCGYEYYATDSDGTKYAITARILDVLKEKDVKAVFFITGNYAKKNPDLVRRMIDEGHIVGNHTSTHPSMPKISIDEMISQVMDLHNYMLEHFDYEMTLFRAPSGEYSVQSLAVVQNLGYKHVFWSFAYADYDTEKQPEREYAKNLITSNHHSGALYLLHAISVTNLEVLGECIDFWRSEGYTVALYS